MKRRSVLNLILIHEELERTIETCKDGRAFTAGYLIRLLEDVIDREEDRESFEFYKALLKATKETDEVKMLEKALNKMALEKGIEPIQMMLAKAYLKTRDDLDEDRDQ